MGKRSRARRRQRKKQRNQNQHQSIEFNTTKEINMADKTNNSSAAAGGSHRVLVMKDSHMDYPDMWLDVFIAGDEFEQAAFADMFVQACCRKAKSPLEADLVVFTGGADVDPALYGEKAHPQTRFSASRDEADLKLYKVCLDNGIPMFGVCRGAQFLHVMNGGKLFQHVNNHNGDHSIYDVVGMRVINKVSSVHHQMVRANKGMTVLAESSAASIRWLNDTDKIEGTIRDIEAYFYRDTCCIGVQGHPEYKNYSKYMQWCLDLIQKYVVENPDIALIDGYRRIKKDLLELRADAADAKGDTEAVEENDEEKGKELVTVH